MRREGATLGPARDGQRRPALVSYGHLVGDSTSPARRGLRDLAVIALDLDVASAASVSRMATSEANGFWARQSSFDSWCPQCAKRSRAPSSVRFLLRLVVCF